MGLPSCMISIAITKVENRRMPKWCMLRNYCINTKYALTHYVWSIEITANDRLMCTASYVIRLNLTWFSLFQAWKVRSSNKQHQAIGILKIYLNWAVQQRSRAAQTLWWQTGRLLPMIGAYSFQLCGKNGYSKTLGRSLSSSLKTWFQWCSAMERRNVCRVKFAGNPWRSNTMATSSLVIILFIPNTNWAIFTRFTKAIYFFLSDKRNLHMPNQSHCQNTAKNVHTFNFAGEIVRKIGSSKPLMERRVYIIFAQV